MSAPLRIGILRDHPTAGGDAFARIVRLACDDVRAERGIDAAFEVVEEQADGLPRGTAAAVEAAFARLVDRGVVAVIGPAISDNGLVVRDLADAQRLACVNWTGGEQTRSEWMFHYQVGSLEEEPGFLALHLAAHDLRRVALVDDRSLVGRRYVEFFHAAVARFGIALSTHVQAPDEADAGGVVARLRETRITTLVYLGLWDVARALALEMTRVGWQPRAFTNSALMYGHANAQWRREWDGWTYVDAYSDDNPVLRAVTARLGPEHGTAPVTVAAAYDMGRLVAEGIASAPERTRAGVKDGLERVKLVPAALGGAGTTMGFGRWERAALKGRFLVLRTWRDGASVEI